MHCDVIQGNDTEYEKGKYIIYNRPFHEYLNKDGSKKQLKFVQTRENYHFFE